MTKLQKGVSVERKTHNTGSDKQRATQFLSGLKRSIEANSLKSIEKLAKSRNVRKMTISKAVRKDWKMKSSCRQRRCILTAKSKAIRIERSLLLLNYPKNRGDVPEDIWPSTSPDLNPCDCWLWCEVEKVSNNDAHTSI